MVHWYINHIPDISKLSEDPKPSESAVRLLPVQLLKLG